MQSLFLPEVETVLRTVGWYPDRKVGSDEIYRWNSLRPLFPAAQEALEEFAYLVIPFGVDKEAYYLEGFCIDPVEAWYHVGSNEEINDYESELGQVYPLGFDGSLKQDGKIEIVSGSMTFYMDGRGRIFADAYDLLFVGDTIQTAIENLILIRELPPWDFKKDAPKRK